MRTVEILQLQDRIEEKARELGVPTRLLLRNYLMERLLERISVSPWREKIVFKGDMLLATLMTTRRRPKVDEDAPPPPVQGFNLAVDDVESIFASLVATNVGDGVSFTLVCTQLVRHPSDHPCVRVFLHAEHGPLTLSFPVDITAAEAVAPDTLAFGHALTYDNRYISLFAYPPAACLAERLEAVIGSGTTHVRMRDYFDIFVLWRTRGEEFAPLQVGRALHAVAEERGTLELMGAYREQMSAVAESPVMHQQWEDYQKQCDFAQDIALSELCAIIREIMAAADWPAYASK